MERNLTRSVSAKLNLFNLQMLNYAFAVLLVLVFVIAAGPLDKILILYALLGSTVIAYAAFLFRSLSLDGMKTAVLVGTITLGLGGLEFATYLLFFFIGSNVLGLLFNAKAHTPSTGVVERRNSDQVWANSFWFILFLILYYNTGIWSFAVASAASIAVANSDTWATVTGSTSRNEHVKLAFSFKKVPVGSDGGMSLRGTAGALTGALAIAGLVWFFHGSSEIYSIAAVFISGFSGCMIDSYFGAQFQYNSRTLKLGGLKIRPGNNLVNFMAVGTGSILAIIIYNLFVYALV